MRPLQDHPRRSALARFPLATLLLLVSLASPSLAATLATDLAGRWSGQIDTPGMALRVTVTFDRAAPDADWTGAIDIPQQGANGLPIADIRLDADRLRFKLANIPGDPTFDGTVQPDGRSIKGNFTQGGLNTTFTLARGEPQKPRRPQDPVPPFPYDVENVRIPVGAPDDHDDEGNPKGFFLAGTITRPKGQGPFPAAILISGSGPQNRDEELLNHRPFAVLADHLTRAGILVLRYDDRGVAESGGVYAGATMADFADDAEACLRFLRDRADVGPVGLIGHSEGGRVAPMVAARSADVRFLVLLAGPGVPGHELLTRQNELLVLAGGGSKAVAAKVRNAAAALFSAVNADAEPARTAELLRALVLAQMEAAGQREPQDEQERAQWQEALDQQAAQFDTPWFRHFLADDPRPDLTKVRVPVLAINGEHDVQVDPKQNLPAIEAALREAGNKDVTTRELPGLNHLFQKVPNGSVALYAITPETFNPGALDAVRDWIAKRFIQPADARPPSPQ